MALRRWSNRLPLGADFPVQPVAQVRLAQPQTHQRSLALRLLRLPEDKSFAQLVSLLFACRFCRRFAGRLIGSSWSSFHTRKREAKFRASRAALFMPQVSVCIQ